MAEPTATLHALRAATADLLRGLAAAQWSDADVALPSLCAGWTRGHVLTHLARNADGITDTLAGALRGEIVARYPDGPAGRDAAIEAGARRPFTVLAADVRDSADRLDRVFGAIGEAGAWDRPSEHNDPAQAWVFRRWCEVEVHRVDLDADYTPDRWPPQFVAALLPELLDGLGARSNGPLQVRITPDGSLGTDHVGLVRSFGHGEDTVEVSGPDWAVLAWLIGRPAAARDALTAAPELAPWR